MSGQEVKQAPLNPWSWPTMPWQLVRVLEELGEAEACGSASSERVSEATTGLDVGDWKSLNPSGSIPV